MCITDNIIIDVGVSNAFDGVVACCLQYILCGM